MPMAEMLGQGCSAGIGAATAWACGVTGGRGSVVVGAAGLAWGALGVDVVDAAALVEAVVVWAGAAAGGELLVPAGACLLSAAAGVWRWGCGAWYLRRIRKREA